MNFLKIFALIFTIITSCVGDHEDGDRDQYKKKYCASKNIIGSNIESEFAKITKCHVIEGHLRLHRCTLPEGAVFPNLTQVTGYIILERVKGLYSLAKLFPKLVIIRGEELFDKYALILHGNLDLVEIGPSVLSSIHGAVHVEDNVMMCTDDRELNKLVEGRYQDYNVMKNNLDFCPFIGCEEDGYCKVRDRSCKSLGLECPTKKNCSSECIGGCYESSNHSTSCVACKNFELDLYGKRKCVKNCPEAYLNFMNYRCLTWEECTSMGGSVLYPNNAAFLDEVTRKGKMYQKNQNITRCIKDCPKKFIKDQNVTNSGELFRICEPRQVCETTIITNTNLGENLQHCKSINGNLIILVAGGKNVIEHLTKNLENIETITGYLKVAGSNALYSLSFLSNLMSVEGKEMINRGEHDEGYSLYLTENANLKELIDFDFRPEEKKQLEINGSVYIHYNEKLCNREIEKFLEVARIKNGRITNNTNENCVLFETHLKAVPGSKNGTILISFVQNYCGIDYRLVVYQIFYRPVSKTENVSKYHKRDVCDDKLFKTEVVEPRSYHSSCVEYEIRCLTPNTRYAIYIESFALDNNIKDKIESSIVYATTYANIEKPNTGKLELTNDSILLSYKHPKVPSYIVPDEIYYEVIRNIYGDPVEEENMKEENVTEKELVPVAESECKCSTLSTNTFFIKDQIRESIEIENEISGVLISRKNKNSRSKRTTESSKELDTSSGPCLSCVCFLKSYVLPNAYDYNIEACKIMMSNPTDCKKPNVNYTVSSFTFKKSLSKSECEVKDEIYCRTKNTSISISLPNASVMPENISVSVRACIRKMKPCPPLEIEEECSICSDFLTLTIDNNSEAKLDDSNETSGFIIFIISGAIVVLLVLSIFAILYPKIANKNNSRDLKTCTNEYYHIFEERFKESSIAPDLLEISSNILGEGDFGKVYEACIAKTKKKIPCAVKTIKPEGKCDRLDEFWDEESIMMKLDNFFVVKLYHTSLHEILGFCFAMELMKMNLSKYIITHTHSLTEKEMVEILVQVALGMTYLHSKNIVFRDLASRNVLIKPNTEENLPIICKISDFGFARELNSETKEYVIKRRFVPRLTAPEAIKGCYTLPSDVYSFGILIYECLITKCIDKSDKECTDEEIKKMVPKIELPLPPDLDANYAFLTSIMNKTQKDDPKERPTFKDIVNELYEKASDDFVNWCEFQFEFGNTESLDSASNSFNDNSISVSTLEACENEQDSESDCNDNACLAPKECSWNNSSCLSINCIQDTIYCTKKLFSKSEKDEHSFPQDRMY
nr:insulin-like receptor 1 [Platyarthrus hoffmannseggii]